MKKIFFLCLMTILTLAINAQIRVTPTGDDNNDGSGWENDKAKKTVAAAIAAAKTATTDVWVKTGTYTDVWGSYTSAQIAGVNIYGSFEGNETTLAERTAKKVVGGKAWEYSYPTVISNSTESVFAISENLTTEVIVDGFIFDGNDAIVVNRTIITCKSGFTLQNCVIKNNNLGTGRVISGAPGTGTAPYASAINCLFENNTTTGAQGVDFTASGNSKVEGCSFIGNTFSHHMLRVGAGIVNNCVFYNNQCGSNSGAAFLGSTGTVASNLLFYNNTARNIVDGVLTLTNSTIVNNKMTFTTGTVILLAEAKIYNTVMAENKNGNNAIGFVGNVAAEVKNCAFDGAALGGNVIPANNQTLANVAAAKFISPSTFVGFDATKQAELEACDWNLKTTSDAIDAGDNTLLPSSITLDLAGTKRIKGTAIDIGAYEGLAKNVFAWTQNLTVIEGNTLTLTAAATDGIITYTSDATGVATVNGTTLTGVAVGTANITAALSGVDGTEYQTPATTTITKEVSVMANVPPVALTLTVDPASSGTAVVQDGTNNPCMITPFSEVALTATAANSYRFEGWYDDATKLSGTAAHTYVMPNAAKTLTAKFVPTYTLSTAGANGSLGLLPAGGVYAAGDVIKVTVTTTDANYKFVSWTDGTTTVTTATATNYTMPAANTILTATFMPTYTLTLEKGTGCATVTGGGTYTVGESVTLTAIGSAGYGFEKWTNGDGAVVSTTNPFSYTTTGAAVTLTANYITVTTIFVTTDGDDANNGYTWATAKKTVAAAVVAASSGVAVWVKAGTYTDSWNPDGGESTTAYTLAQIEGVSIYGGFAGTETAINQRAKGAKPWEYKNETIIKWYGTTSRFVCNLVLTKPTIIDGFTFSDYNTFNTATGIFQFRNFVTIQNCIMRNNLTWQTASPTNTNLMNIYINTYSVNPAKVLNCLFEGNTTNAQMIQTGSVAGLVHIDGCEFVGNRVNNAILNLGGTSATARMYLRNSVFYNNYARDYVVQGSQYTQTYNCSFYNNEAGHSILWMNITAGAIIANTTVVNNKTGNSKGGIDLSTGVKIYNTVVAGNTTKGLTNANITKATTAEVKNCAFDAALPTSDITITEADNLAVLTNVAAAGFANPTTFVGVDRTKDIELGWVNDFSLAASSPLIATGDTALFKKTDLGKIDSTDIEGLPRFSDNKAKICIGAFEYNATLLDNPITWAQDLALDMNSKPSETLNASAQSSVSYLSGNTLTVTVAGNVINAVSPGATTITAYANRTATHKRAVPVEKNVAVAGALSTLDVTPKTIAFDKTATTQTVTLTSNYAAKMVANTATWLTVTPSDVTQADAATGKVITIAATTNPTVAARAGMFVFFSGGKWDTVYVTQAKGDPTLSVTGSPVTLPGAEGAVASFNVVSNTTWEVELTTALEGVSIAPLKGTGNGAVTFTALQDATATGTGTYTVKVVGHTEFVPANVTVTLTQSVYTAGTIRYVDGAQADDTGDGASWENAKKTIDAALTLAASGDNIYVKAGKYRLAAPLALKSGVRIYGGFNDETNKDNRAKGAKAWNFTNETVIIPAAGQSTFNLTATTLALPMVIDGVSIDSAKAVVLKKVSSPVGAKDSIVSASAINLQNNMFLYNSIVRNSYVNTTGVGVRMTAAARVWNSYIANNKMWLDSVSAKVYYGTNDHAPHGAMSSGVGISLTLPSSGSTGYTPLKGNTISNNFGGPGAGVQVGGGTGYSGITQIVECVIEKNRTIGFNTVASANNPGNSGGGGMILANMAPSIVVVEDCLFDSNEQVDPISTLAAGTPGGGAVRAEQLESFKYFNRCVFTGNKAFKGQIFDVLANGNTNVKLFNCIFYKNDTGQCLNNRDGVTSINNTFYKNVGPAFGFNTGPKYNNLAVENAEGGIGNADEGNFAEVLFTDITAVNTAGNVQGLRHAIFSPSVDKGKTITAKQTYTLSDFEREFVASDYNKVARPQGFSYDPGAFEYVKMKPTNVSINWTQDLTALNISNTDEVALTASLDGVSEAQQAYLLPMKYVTGDDLTVEPDGSTLILMGSGTTTLEAHSNINSYYDTVSMSKPVTVTGTGFIAASPRVVDVTMYVNNKAGFFRTNSDQTWIISGTPSWLTTTIVPTEVAGRDTVWLATTDNNSLNDPRSAVLTLTAANGKTRTVRVNQDGLIFSISTNRVDFTLDKAEDELQLTANLAWIADMGEADWMSVTPIAGEVSRTLFLSVEDNETDTTRTGTLTIYADRDGVTPLEVTVVQTGKTPPNSVSKKELLTVVVYPNPTTNVLYVQTIQDLKEGELSLFNVQGALVYTKTFNGNSNQIDMSNLPSGNYILKLSADKDAEISVKVLKQ